MIMTTITDPDPTGNLFSAHDVQTPVSSPNCYALDACNSHSNPQGFAATYQKAKQLFLQSGNQTTGCPNRRQVADNKLRREDRRCGDAERSILGLLPQRYACHNHLSRGIYTFHAEISMNRLKCRQPCCVRHRQHPRQPLHGNDRAAR
jgi:hypothetical protein